MPARRACRRKSGLTSVLGAEMDVQRFAELFGDIFRGEKVNKRETYNSLSHEKFYKLTRFLDDTRELYSGIPADQVATKASEHLGFSVTETNIKNARGVLGITVKRAASTTGQRNHDRVRVVAGAVLGLFKELGISPPEDLYKIWRKQ